MLYSGKRLYRLSGQTEAEYSKLRFERQCDFDKTEYQTFVLHSGSTPFRDISVESRESDRVCAQPPNGLGYE